MTKTVVAAFLRPNQVAFAVASAFLSAGVAAQTAPGTLPTGGQVTSGSASLTYTPNKLQIDQGSNKAILQWDSFSIGSSAWVNFSQPSASSVALNRVTGTNPSEIFGRLSSNGQVFLSNPNGVLFAPSASVDVGGLFATTLSIADRDFLAGRYNFYNAGGAGSVINQGVITATGYASLAGPQVRNDGIIIARAGTVALAAGDRVSLDMVGDGLIKVSVEQSALNASAINTGRIEADGGNVVLTARSANALLDTVVNNSGVIRANSLVERNGEIVLDGGSAGTVVNSGSLQAAGVDAGTSGGTIKIVGDRVGVTGVVDASGDAGGGSITVGSPATSATFITSDATIRADATREGNGGFVETSGRYLEVNAAPQVGAGGTWLIDPYNIEIVDGSGTSNNNGPTTFTPTSDNSQIGATLINNQLNSGVNVVVDTGGAGSLGTQTGDLIVNAEITKSAFNGSSLTLSAFHDLQINRNISMATGTLNFNAGRITNNAAVSNGGGLGVNTVLSSDAFSLAGGTINGGAGAVILRPRAATNSFGIESAGATTVTNADIASISTSDYIVFGSGNTTLFSGSMGIGANTQVDGGGKNLAFFRGSVPGSTTLGSFGVATTGNVIVSAGGGSLTGSGLVAGNQVQLRASSGIGSAASRVNTSANVLAINNTGGPGAFVNATNAVTLSNVNLVVGGNVNNVSNTVGGGGAYDLTAANAVAVTGTVSGGTMNVNAAGPLKVLSTGGVAASLTATSGQTIAASSIEITADGINAQIANNSGNQNITTTGNISLQNSNAGFSNSFAGILAPTQTISASGSVSLTARNAPGTFQGVRIGAGSGATSTNLTLVAGGDVTLTGGSGVTNGVGLGSSVVTSFPNNITISAGGNVVLNSGIDGGARIGYAQGLPAGGDITINAAGIQLNGTAQPTAIRTTGNLTLNTTGSVTQASNGYIAADKLLLKVGGAASLTGANTIGTVTAPLQSGVNGIGGSFTLNNTGTLTVSDVRAGGSVSITNAGAASVNGVLSTVGGSTIDAASINLAGTIANNGGNTLLSADAFSLAGGAVNGGAGAVILRPHTASNSFGIEAPGTTTVTNADIAALSTSDFVVFGSGLGTNFTGNMTIGANAQVDGGGKNLAFFRASVPGSTTLGSFGVATSGNVIVSAGGGALDGSSIVAGNQVQLRASSGIGSAASRINTSANVLAINNTGGPGAFVNATGPVTLSNVNLLVGGNVNNVSNTVGGGGAYDLIAGNAVTVTGTVTGGTMNLNAAGPLKVLSTGGVAASLTANAGQTISASSLEVTADGINAQIANSSGNQSITTTGNISLQNSTTNFTNSFAGILGPTQTISAGGNVSLKANLAGGTSQGVRIGAGSGATSTNLTLVAGGDVTLTGGSGVTNGVGLGSSVVTSFPNNITISAGGNVVLNSGVDGGARIGYAQNLPAGGDITISAAGVQLNGTSQPTAIRTQGTINLNLGGGAITEAANGSIAAGTLNVNAGTASLGGPNQIGTLTATTIGDFSLVNSGALAVTSLLAGSSSLTNTGAVTVTGPWSSGAMTVSASDALTVTGSLQAFGNQTITAGSLAVTGQNGGSASLTQSGSGTQSITVTGGSIDVHTLGGGGSAFLTSTGVQNVSLVNGDHISVNGAFGTAVLQAFQGTQTISATGTGRNAITVGSAGALGASNIAALNQTVTAGNLGEAGSITIVGSAAQSALAGFVTNQGAGGTQTISTSGRITVAGGSAASQLSNFGTGIFHNGTGAQTVNAQSITITGGNAGNVNAAFISSLGGGVVANAGNQVINLAGGDLTITAGSVGFGNRAGLTSSANQTINGAGAITVTGGAGGTGVGTSNTANNAFISASTAGRLQTINNAASITVNAGSGGNDTSATINGTSQVISVTGDVTINGGGGTGTANGARIGGSVGAATNLVLNAHNVVVNGGTANGAGIGSSITGTPLSNTIAVNATGDVTLNSGNSGARIGSASNGTAGGDIAVNAGGNIALNGVANATSIRTTGNVTLQAGGNLTSTTNGFVLANSLATKSTSGATSLIGPNNVSFLSGTSGTSLSFVNGGPLTVNGVLSSGSTMDLNVGGTLSVVGNAGTPASINSIGGQSIIASSLDVRSNGANATITNNGGNQTITVNGGAIDVHTVAPSGFAQILENGAGVQTITANAADHIDLTAQFGNASIQAINGGTQNVSITGTGASGSGRIHLENSSSGFLNSFAGINAAQQNITASGDITLQANFATGTSHGVRIGGIGGVPGTDTNLTLTSTGGNVVLSGGTGAANGAALGSTVASAHPSTITVNAQNGQLILNSGADAGARVGYAQGLPAAGDITINAVGLQLNGTTQGTAIRTQGAVNLNLTGAATEATNGFIVANTLTAKVGGSASFTGPNSIATLSVPLQFGAPGIGGNFSLNNTGALTITDLRANGTVSLTNAGAITLSASGSKDARITSVGGQTISADALIVHAQDGRVANINNNSGDQTFIIGAGGIDLSVVNGQGVAQIANNRGAVTNGKQTVQTSGALNVVGGSTTTGSVNSGVFQMQTGKQTVTASSITLAAANAPVNIAGALISSSNSNNVADQEINVAGGTISITGGGGGLANRAGISGNGNQAINGNPDIILTGGSSGTGTGGNANSVFISANGAGKQQTINAGNITVNAGSGGTDTSATITGTKQTIVATGDVRVNGGSNSGDSNGARIGGAAGNTASATDLTLTARDVILTAGTTASGAALGSSGNTATPLGNNITVNASRDVILNASATNGVRIGTNSDFAIPAAGNISVTAGRDMALNGDAHAAGIRTTGNVALSAGGAISEGPKGLVIAGALTTQSGGSATLGGPNEVGAFNATSGGDVTLVNSGVLDVTGLSATGNATLDNTGNVTVSGPWSAGGTTSITVHSDLVLGALLSSPDVVLSATSGAIREQGAGAIHASNLTTSSAAETGLGGANQVGRFSASSGSDVLFTNASPGLSLGAMNVPGALTINHTGALSLTTSASSVAQSYSATGDITVGDTAATTSTVLSASGAMAMSSGGSIVLRASDSTPGVSAIVSGGTVSMASGGDLRLIGGAAAGSQALVLGGSTISLTVGGTLSLDGTSDTGSWARVQTATTGGTINLYFPTVSSGGYLVDGFERLKHGEDGFFTGDKPAKSGTTLFLHYGP